MKNFNYTIFFLLGVCLFTSCKPMISKQDVYGVKGVLDLQKHDFNQRPIVNLKGQWEFYWDRLLIPTDFKKPNVPKPTGFVKIPEVWNRHDIQGQTFAGQGYATYKLHVILPDNAPQLAMKMLTFSTAAKVYVNGIKISSSGKVGTTSATMQPEYHPQIVALPEHTRKLEIIIQVSNFYYTKGGIWDPVALGKKKVVTTSHKRDLIFHMFFAGSICVMAFYSLLIYYIRKNDTVPLFWGFFCF